MDFFNGLFNIQLNFAVVGLRSLTFFFFFNPQKNILRLESVMCITSFKTHPHVIYFAMLSTRGSDTLWTIIYVYKGTI